MNATETATTTQVYRVWIKATPEAIWDAITKPEWTDRYGYGGIPEFDLRPGAPLRRPPGRGDARVPRTSRTTSSTARSSRPTRRAGSR